MFSFIVDVISICKDAQSAMGQDRNMDAITEIFVAQWELVRTKETVFLSTSLIGFLTRYKHSPTSGSQIIK